MRRSDGIHTFPMTCDMAGCEVNGLAHRFQLSYKMGLQFEVPQ